MNVILSSVRWHLALVYFDDIFIIIFPMTPEKHIDHAKKLLTLLQGAEVTLRMMQCSFFTDTLEYLGHIFQARRLEIGDNTAGSIRNFKQ